MKSALLAAAWNSDDWTFEALEAHYKTLVRYLNLEDMGYGAGLWLRHPIHDPATLRIPSRRTALAID